MGRGEATSKAKLSCNQRNSSCKANSKLKSTSTHHKPKKRVKVPPYKYKMMSDHFPQIEQKAQLQDQLGAPEDHPT